MAAAISDERVLQGWESWQGTLGQYLDVLYDITKQHRTIFFELITRGKEAADKERNRIAEQTALGKERNSDINFKAWQPDRIMSRAPPRTRGCRIYKCSLPRATCLHCKRRRLLVYCEEHAGKGTRFCIPCKERIALLRPRP